MAATGIATLTAADFFDQLASIFDRHFASASPRQSLVLDVGNSRAQIRCGSEALFHGISRPLVTSQVLPADAPHHFSLDFVDCRAAGMPLPALPWKPDRTSPQQETGEYRQGPFLFTLHGDAVLTAMHAAEHRTVGFVADPVNWPLDHYKQAIFITLYQHLRHRGLHLIHASAIGLGERVLLIAGSAGVGKTTSMLTCISAGFNFLGDDTTLVARTPAGGFQVISLLQTINVTDQTLAWFPELAQHRSGVTNASGKWLVMADEAYPGCVTGAGTVGLILVPEITDQARTTVEPASRLDLLKDMLPFSLDLPTAGAASRQLDFLVALLETIPSYRLKLGRDREHLAPLVAELLGAERG